MGHGWGGRAASVGYAHPWVRCFLSFVEPSSYASSAPPLTLTARSTILCSYRFAQLTVKEPLDEDDEPLHTVHLYDFSPCRVHWDDLETSSPDDWNPLPQVQGVIDSPVWEAPFRSALPGVKRLVGVFPESQAPAGVMLDEERIILSYNRPLVSLPHLSSSHVYLNERLTLSPACCRQQSSDWEFRIKAM